MTEKLYVIEDDAPTVMLLKRYIRRAQWDVEVHHFEYGSDALTHFTISQEKIGVLLLDLNLPDMSGIDILRTLRHSEKYRNLPVIVLTTSNLEHERKSCYELGVSHFLEKPFDFETLVNLLRELGLSFAAA